MGEWVIGAFINLVGSIAINFGTNLLKLGHTQMQLRNTPFLLEWTFGFPFSSTLCSTPWFLAVICLCTELWVASVMVNYHENHCLWRERHSILDGNGTNGKLILKPITHFQTWRVGILFFALGNCLNFISFGYAAQSLLAALGSVQFVSNIAFAYFVLNKMVTVKVLVATTFIVLGNVFLVAFGNHQSPVFTPEQLAEKYNNIVFLLYCLILVVVVVVHHSIYRRGELLLSVPGHDLSAIWHMLLPFSYAMVSGAVGSCSVLFAKSLSNLLRLTMSSGYQLHTWFTYSMLLLFLSTAGFWMARLNEGLSLFDAILIVPMFQIAWTFFSICTGFVYFQEYQVFDALRTTMFMMGMTCVFIGMCLLAPDDSKGVEGKDSSSMSSSCSSITTDDRSVKLPSEETGTEDLRSIGQALLTKLTSIIMKTKTTCAMFLGLGEDSINASSIFVMPMVSSRMNGLRGTTLHRDRLFFLKNPGWARITIDEDDIEMLETSSMLL